MPDPFTREFHVRWGDLDFNGHMKNTAYLDTAADVRLMYFDSRGFSLREFERSGSAPSFSRKSCSTSGSSGCSRKSR